MQTKKGFTLIELLVVISIIALLMAVMMPALARAREQARMIICSSNQRTLVLGATLWSEDNDGYAIAGDWWKNVGENETESSITPYIEASREKAHDSMACPSARTLVFESINNYNTSGQEFTFTYASNGYLTYNIHDVSPGVIDGPPYDARVPGGSGLYGPYSTYWTVRGSTKIATVRNPSRIAYFIDHEYYFVGAWFFDPTKPLEEFPASTRFKTRWHQKRATENYGVGIIGWLDGRVTREPDDFAEVYQVNGRNRQRWRDYYSGPGR